MVIGITDILYIEQLNLKRKKLGKICCLNMLFSHALVYFYFGKKTLVEWYKESTNDIE